MCDQIFPKGKWTACSMIEDIKRAQYLKKINKNLSYFKRFESKCCLYTLHIAEFPLLQWNNDNPYLSHVIEIFLAIVCYYMLYRYPKSKEIDNDRKRDINKRYFLEFIEDLREIWVDKTQNTGIAGQFLNNVTLCRKKFLEEKELYESYLTEYLTKRNIPNDVLTKEINFSHYLTLFDEYFTRRKTRNLITNWGYHNADDIVDNAYTKRLITTHARLECDACVGFVCFVQSKSLHMPAKMQGIVSCPFYKTTFSNEKYILGSANTILHYMHEKLQGRKLQVDPIDNPDWKNRLSQIPFIVDPYGKPIMKSQTTRKRKINCLKSSCEDKNSDSDE